MIESKKLKQLHEHENEFNKEIGKIDKKIFALIKRKRKLQKQVSRNMIYRNQLINELKK